MEQKHYVSICIKMFANLITKIIRYASRIHDEIKSRIRSENCCCYIIIKTVIIQFDFQNTEDQQRYA
jgi:hypothetical protein